MAPKKKAQKMALSDFFADGPSVGSWADDDEIALPSAPAPKDPSAPKRGDPGYLDSMPDRSARTFPGVPPQREEVPLPTVPPFTAFVGGLAFETSDAELLDYFTDLAPITTRLVKDNTGKSKGFGYVEFPDVENLKSALSRTGSQFGGRTIRVSVAEPPSSRREYTPSAAEESSQWRRSGPLPARDPPAPRRTGGGGFGSPNMGGAEPERDWGAARGARFVPSPQAPPHHGGGAGLRREGSGPGFRREEAPHTHSVADDANEWRSSRPLVEAPQAPPAGQKTHPASTPGMADTETTWSRGTKLRAPAPAPVAAADAAASSPSPADDKDWRRPVSSRNGSTDGERTPAQAQAPAERKKLNLAKRSTPAEASGASTPENADSPRASIFGGAKPIDSAAKEAAAADKLATMDKERKAAALKARLEEENKAKSLAEERERSIKEAQEKALREAGVLPAAAQAQGQGQTQGARGGGNAWGGRGRGGAHGAHGAHGRPVQRGTPPHQAQAAPAASQAPKPKREVPEKKVDEDGFEVAGPRRGGAAAKAAAAAAPAQAGAAQAPQGGQVRKGFSWSSVAAGGLDGGDADDKDVDEVRKAVDEVKV